MIPWPMPETPALGSGAGVGAGQAGGRRIQSSSFPGQHQLCYQFEAILSYMRLSVQPACLQASQNTAYSEVLCPCKGHCCGTFDHTVNPVIVLFTGEMCF